MKTVLCRLVSEKEESEPWEARDPGFQGRRTAARRGERPAWRGGPVIGT